MINRRTILAGLTTAALLQGVSLAYAAEPIKVQIIGLAHWPVQNALKPILEMLEGFGDKINVVEFDADTTEGKELMSAAGQQGHVPVLILIDGEYQFTRADGSDIEFLNFPTGADNPLDLNGSWNVDDVESVITGMIGG